MNNQTQDQNNQEEGQGKAIKNSGVISLFNGFGFASALLVDIVIAARFGLSRETDAFFVAYTLPQLVSSILLVVFNVVLVPIFTRIAIEEGETKLWQASSNLINIGIIVFGILSGARILTSSLIVGIQGAGLEGTTKSLATELNQILFLMVIPLGGIEVLKAILNSQREFAFPAATTLIQNFFTFLTLIVLGNSFGIKSLAIGYVLATWIQFFVLMVVGRIKGFRYRLFINFRDENLQEALKQMRYPLSGAILGQSNIIFERFLASFLPTGMISAIGYARRILAAVDRIFLSSISTAFLPRLSSQYTNNKLSEFRQSLGLALRLSIFTSFPITAGIIGLSIFIVDILFGRGAFDVNATAITAKLMSIYIISIPSVAIFQLLNSAYYAFRDTKTPFNPRVITLVSNIAFDVLFFFLFGAPGLALALTVGRIIGTVYISRLITRKFEILTDEFKEFVFKIAFSSVTMGALVYLLRQMIFSASPDILRNFSSLITWSFLAAIVGFIIFVLMMFVLRIREIKRVMEFIKQRRFFQTR